MIKTPKAIKVFYHGERMKDVYPYASGWQMIKYRVAMFLRKLVIISMITGAIAGSYKIGGLGTPEIVTVEAEDKSTEIFTGKIDTLKSEVVEKLRACESGGFKESDGIIIFDSNNKASIGTLQFQKSTVIHYYKVLYGETITSKDAVMIALDNEKAGKLAKDIMFTTKNKAGKDWYVCSQKFGLDAQIDLIKKLEN